MTIRMYIQIMLVLKKRMTIVSYTFIVVIAVDLLATSGDIALSWTSPTYPKLFSADPAVNPLGEPITADEDAWLGSLLTIGAVIGPLPFGYIAEKFGRKVSLLCIAVPHVLSYGTMAVANHIYLFYLGRILGGLAMGGGYAMLPMYIAEISQDSNRGMMSQTLNVFWALGNFLPYAIGPFMSILSFNVILACIPTAFFVIFLLVGPETPYYLVGAKKIEQAEESLMLLRSADKKGIQKELGDIQLNLKKEDARLADVFKKSELRRALLICLVLIVAQEMSGFCAITFYLQPIFEAAGTGISADISAVLVGFSMLISSFVAPLLVDRAGRKLLTIFSCFGMFIALLMLGAFFYIQDSTSTSSAPIFWMPIFSLIFYIFSFNLGIGSVPWTLCSELFPSNVKQFAASAVSITCWVTSFVVTKFFNDMNRGMGRAGTFWFFSGICLAAAVFSILYVPETKGKSFSDIQDMLRGSGRDLQKS